MFFTNKKKSDDEYVRVGKNEFLVFFANDCFTAKPLLADKQQEIYTYLKNEIKSNYQVLPKVRLLEFLNPVGDIDEQKRLILEIQNITTDIIIINDDRNVIAVILIEPTTRTAFYEKKLSYTERICELVNVKFTILKDVIDIETNGVISEYLKED
ncbi:DUF2726 domain-containing protein [Xenorhabdus entomophaga]|uniref:DUF2726 domain-containing protein n=1 Tax=Xenorhabdus entomophaga TaxID=3136257 RepID=UPI0030F387C6